MNKDKPEKHFNDVLEDLELDLKSGTITYNVFCKKVVNLAYDCALQGFSTDAFYMMINLDPEYFKSQCIKDFDEDKDYFNKGVFLFEIFKYNNWVEEYIEITQAMAEA